MTANEHAVFSVRRFYHFDDEWKRDHQVLPILTHHNFFKGQTKTPKTHGSYCSPDNKINKISNADNNKILYYKVG